MFERPLADTMAPTRRRHQRQRGNTVGATRPHLCDRQPRRRSFQRMIDLLTTRRRRQGAQLQEAQPPPPPFNAIVRTQSHLQQQKTRPPSHLLPRHAQERQARRIAPGLGEAPRSRGVVRVLHRSDLAQARTELGGCSRLHVELLAPRKRQGDLRTVGHAVLDADAGVDLDVPPRRAADRAFHVLRAPQSNRYH